MGLLLAVLLPLAFHSSAHAFTLSSQYVNGKFIPRSGPLPNPSLGLAVDIAALIGKANPWVTGLYAGYSIYKIVQDINGQDVSVRPSDVSEKVDDWPNNQPSNPGTFYPSTTLYRTASQSIWYPSKDASGTADCAARTTYTQWDLSTSVCRNPSNPSAYASVTFYQQIVNAHCDSGYTLSGSTCNLTNANLVKYPSDGVVTLMVDAMGHFIADPRDPDALLPANQPIIGDDVLEQTQTDQKAKIKIKSNPDGSITTQTIYEYFDATDASTKQFVQSTTMTKMGDVISYSTTNAPVNFVNGQTVPATSAPSITFPDDYNREATQAALKTAVTEDITAANSEKSALGAGPDVLQYDPVDLGLPGEDHFQVAPTEPLEQLFPVNSGDCVTLPVNLPFFSGLVLDPCNVVTAVRPLIDWAVMAFGLLAGVFVWFGKSEEA